VVRSSAAILAAAALLAGCGGGSVGGIDVDQAQDLAKDVSGRDVSEGESLYVAPNLSRALGTLSDRVGGDATVDLKIEPAALKLRAKGPGEEAQSLAIGVGGGVFQVPLPGDEIPGPLVSEIDPGAVERIARQVASEAGVDLLGISYFTTLTSSEPFRWGVYLEDGRRWEANLDGSGVERVS
jgi:hypothetical protein